MIDNRPLSPHLSIHKKISTAVFSVFHRFTGIGLSISSIIIVFLIANIAFGPTYFFLFEYILSLLIIKIIILIWLFGIFFHLYNGIRYLFWSFGIGMDLKTVYISSYLVILLTFITTLTFWLCW